MAGDDKKMSPASKSPPKKRFTDVSVQTSPDASGSSTAAPSHSRKPARRCGCLSVCVVSVLIALLAVALAFQLKRYERRQMDWVMLRDNLGEDAYGLFSSYDRDKDNHLSLAEFEPLLSKLGLQDNVPVDFDSFMDGFDPNVEVLTVESQLEPLRQETMTKDRSDGLFTKANTDNLAGLDSWDSPYRSMAGFSAQQFTAFLPEGALPVGEVYELVQSNLNMFSNTLSSNRYYPPKATDREVLLHALLSMFHPRPFLHTRFGPQGAAAVIRAENHLYVDVVFRIHAEFQLNEPPVNPFWFTPAQFTGNLIIRRDASHIEHFHLYLPTNKSLNVDMEWMNGPMEQENMEVDIGFMPQMELTAPNPSSHVSVYGENGEVLHEAKQPVNDLRDNNIKWNREITTEEAVGMLDVHFYPFKKVPYLPLADAFHQAAAEEKLVHSILLWGSLDDQSC